MGSFRDQDLFIKVNKEGTLVELALYFGKKKKLAGIKSVRGHIKNMIVGVIKGYKRTLKVVYSHFPINPEIVDGGKTFEVRNFMGCKKLIVVPMREGVTVAKCAAKDTYEVFGDDLD